MSHIFGLCMKSYCFFPLHLEISMAMNKVVLEAQKLESCGAVANGDNAIQVKILQVPAKCGPTAALPPPPTAAAVSKAVSVSAPPKVIPIGHLHQPTSSAVAVTGRQTSSFMVVTKVSTPGGVGASGQPQGTKPVLSQVTSKNQATTPGRTVVITVPRAAGTQTVTVPSRLPQTASTQLPANIQIPPGELQHTNVVV